jgi:uncharacterized iron-regulated membrane protein
VRGGAIPILLWGTLLAVLLAINWIWEGTNLHVAEFGFSVLVIYLAGALLWLLRRDAIRTGPPERDGAPVAVPRMSLAAASSGVAIAVIVYGIEFGKFLIFIGGGLLLLSLGRLGRELMWQQRSLRAMRRRSGEK